MRVICSNDWHELILHSRGESCPVCHQTAEDWFNPPRSVEWVSPDPPIQCDIRGCVGTSTVKVYLKRGRVDLCQEHSELLRIELA